MISLEDDSEFTLSIADMIKTLNKLNAYEVKIWIIGSELPICFNEKDDVVFIQESIKIIGEEIQYIFYDNIVHIKIVYDPIEIGRMRRLKDEYQ